MRKYKPQHTINAINIMKETFEAQEIGVALEVVATKLLEFEILTSSGFSVLVEEGRRLKQLKNSKAWDIFIDRDNAVVFKDSLDKNGNIIIPKITCPGIKIVQDGSSCPPFGSLDIAIEIQNDRLEPIARWHLDWANSNNSVMQSGPLVHLQYGGHNAGHRNLDHPLKAPRWSHPPMDLILMCEVMAANFYEDEWEMLREDQNWNASISVAQRLCYTAYFRKFVSGLSISSKSILHSMWAKEWVVK